MSSKVAVKKVLCQMSGKVKSVRLHPDNPWVLSSQVEGVMNITNYETQVDSTHADHTQNFRGLSQQGGATEMRDIHTQTELDRSGCR